MNISAPSVLLFELKRTNCDFASTLYKITRKNERSFYFQNQWIMLFPAVYLYLKPYRHKVHFVFTLTQWRQVVLYLTNSALLLLVCLLLHRADHLWLWIFVAVFALSLPFCLWMFCCPVSFLSCCVFIICRLFCGCSCYQWGGERLVCSSLCCFCSSLLPYFLTANADILLFLCFICSPLEMEYLLPHDGHFLQFMSLLCRNDSRC